MHLWLKKAFKKGKGLILLMILTLIFPTLAPCFAAADENVAAAGADVVLKDINGHWAEDTIVNSIQKGIVSGYQDQTFKPENSITRAEFIKLVNSSFTFTETKAINYGDVPADAWFAGEIAKASAAGYISGYEDGTIRPDNTITRAEAAHMLTRVKSFAAAPEAVAVFNDQSRIQDWSRGSVGAVVDHEVMSGYPDHSFGPEKQITRAEALVAIKRALTAAVDEKVDEEENINIYDQAGVYGPETGKETIEGSVTLAASGITLKNTAVNGDLILAESIGEGDIYLENVSVKGKTVVKGGGSHSIHLLDCNLPTLVVRKDAVRLVASGLTAVDTVELQSGATLANTDSSMQNFNNVILQVPNIEVEISSGLIRQIQIAKKADGTKLVLGDKTSVKNLLAEAKAQVSGKGQIEKATVSVNGVKLEQKPGNLETASGVKAEVDGELTAGSAISDSSISGGGGGNGDGEAAMQIKGVTFGAGQAVDGAIIELNSRPTICLSCERGITRTLDTNRNQVSLKKGGQDIAINVFMKTNDIERDANEKGKLYIRPEAGLDAGSYTFRILSGFTANNGQKLGQTREYTFTVKTNGGESGGGGSDDDGGDTEPELPGENFDKGGTYDYQGKEPLENVTISAGDVVLKNAKIDGNLTITSNVGNGTVDFENVYIKGKVTVAGGAAVTFKNCDGEMPAGWTSQIPSMDVKKQGVKLTLSGETIVAQLNVYRGMEFKSDKTQKMTVDAAYPAADELNLCAGWEAVNIDCPKMTISYDNPSLYSGFNANAANAEITVIPQAQDLTLFSAAAKGENSKVYVQGQLKRITNVHALGNQAQVIVENASEIGFADIKGEENTLTINKEKAEPSVIEMGTVDSMSNSGKMELGDMVTVQTLRTWGSQATINGAAAIEYLDNTAGEVYLETKPDTYTVLNRPAFTYGDNQKSQPIIFEDNKITLKNNSSQLQDNVKVTGKTRIDAVSIQEMNAVTSGAHKWTYAIDFGTDISVNPGDIAETEIPMWNPEVVDENNNTLNPAKIGTVSYAVNPAKKTELLVTVSVPAGTVDRERSVVLRVPRSMAIDNERLLGTDFWLMISYRGDASEFALLKDREGNPIESLTKEILEQGGARISLRAPQQSVFSQKAVGEKFEDLLRKSFRAGEAMDNIEAELANEDPRWEAIEDAIMTSFEENLDDPIVTVTPECTTITIELPPIDYDAIFGEDTGAMTVTIQWIKGTISGTGGSVGDTSGVIEEFKDDWETFKIDAAVAPPLASDGNLNTSGTYDYQGQAPLNDVTVSAADVTLKNAEINGNLTIAEGAGDSSIVLENLRIHGNIAVNGGKDIIIKDCYKDEGDPVGTTKRIEAVNQLEINKTGAKIVTQENTSFAAIDINAGAGFKNECVKYYNNNPSLQKIVNVNTPETVTVDLNQQRYRAVNLNAEENNVLAANVKAAAIYVCKDNSTVNLAAIEGSARELGTITVNGENAVLNINGSMASVNMLDIRNSGVNTVLEDVQTLNNLNIYNGGYTMEMNTKEGAQAGKITRLSFQKGTNPPSDNIRMTLGKDVTIGNINNYGAGTAEILGGAAIGQLNNNNEYSGLHVDRKPDSYYALAMPSFTYLDEKGQKVESEMVNVAKVTLVDRAGVVHENVYDALTPAFNIAQSTDAYQSAHEWTLKIAFDGEAEIPDGSITAYWNYYPGGETDRKQDFAGTWDSAENTLNVAIPVTAGRVVDGGRSISLAWNANTFLGTGRTFGNTLRVTLNYLPLTGGSDEDDGGDGGGGRG